MNRLANNWTQSQWRALRWLGYVWLGRRALLYVSPILMARFCWQKAEAAP